VDGDLLHRPSSPDDCPWNLGEFHGEGLAVGRKPHDHDRVGSSSASGTGVNRMALETPQTPACTAYLLRHPMHCGVVQFLQYPCGVFAANHYPLGMANPPMGLVEVDLQEGKPLLQIPRGKPVTLATARAIWHSLTEKGWIWDGTALPMNGWMPVEGEPLDWLAES